MLVRSEYSFREVFGPMREVVARLPAWGGVIADTTCYGHVPFAEECKKAGKRAVLGARFMHEGRPAIVVPRSAAGLKALYGAVAGGFSADAVASAGREWAVIVPAVSALPGALRGYFPGVSLASAGCSVASSDNLYPAPGDRQAWGLMLGRLARNRPGSAHILSPEELALEGARPEWIQALRRIVEESDTPLPRAENIRFPVPDAQRELAEICRAELVRRDLDQRPGYAERLEYELRLIAEKKFADYFLVIADMMRYAKQHMLVGPARGSSAGSLVCWLTRITEIDPIRHDLIFERFIDVNRADLPDIDIDFPDTKRELVIRYLGEKYGQQNVAHIGTVIRYKPKSALTDVAKQAGIPLWELDRLKDVMIVRSSGDSRASSCLADSLQEMEIGRQLIAKYPVLKVAARLEDHARSAGVHAAGIVVCNAPVADFCGVKNGEAQLDKGMAEKVNLLKIDALGLRTLSVIEEACALAGLDPLSMYELPLEDPAVFALFNAGKFSGIFQYEGIALQSVARQIKIDCFEDVAAITALARPGPLSGGETTRWIEGKKRGTNSPLHPALAPYTRDTFGTILYQEQVMTVVRSMGNFSWADTSMIRKIMSGRKGNEAFGKFQQQFIVGAEANGVNAADAEKIWKAVNTMGSWAFNRSHAVAYGLLSYWTGWLKAHHPVPFAVANLRHARHGAAGGEKATADPSLVMLRELLREGDIEYTPVDPALSTERWEFAGNRLLGPLTGIKGMGPKTARDLCLRRLNGIPLTARQMALLASPSRFADYAPCRRLWQDLYDHPERHFKTVDRLHEAQDITLGTPNQRWFVLGQLIKKNLRDLNEEKYLVRRNGKRVAEDRKNMLLFHLEDDSGRILCCINSERFARLGIPMVERAAIGAWFVVSGFVPTDFRMLQVDKVKWL